MNYFSRPGIIINNETLQIQQQISTCNAILKLVSDATGVSVDAIRGRCRKTEISFARQIYCYIAKTEKGINEEEISMTLHRNRTTVIWSVKRVWQSLQIKNDKLAKVYFKVKAFKQ